METMNAQCEMEDLPVNNTIESVSNREFSKGERFLRLAAVQDLVPVSRAKIYRDVSAGTFPRPIALGPGTVAWRESDIFSWMQARIAGSAEAR